MLHQWCMLDSCKADTHQDISYMCFDLSNLYMGMYMTYINHFTHTSLKGKLMNSFPYKQTTLMYILYNN